LNASLDRPRRAGAILGDVARAGRAAADGSTRWNESAGHVGLEPLQTSARSQTPADARHCVPFGVKVSAGHAAAEPVQFSAGSHDPADGRQTVALETKLLLGQFGPVPVQTSAVSQSPALGRQTWVFGW
jgi:hypothetical protein